jgi:hypothetical protein
MVKLLRWSRSFHRWIAYGLGLIVALWVITGIVMMIPPGSSTRPVPAVPVDPAAATRTPAEAAQSLPNPDIPVRTVTLRDLAGRAVYHFVLRNGSHAFVDAATAQRIEFTDSLARLLARRALVDSTTTMSLTRLDAFDARYSFGALPAYRVELGDEAGTIIHVGADGSINPTTRFGRFRAVMGHLHEFQLPRNRVPDGPRRLSLIFTGSLTIILVLTGYVLVIPLWRRNPQ